MKDGLKMVNMLAGIMPKEDIIEMLKESCIKWQMNPTDENFKKISFNSMLLVMRDGQEQEDKDTVEGIKRIDKVIEEGEQIKALKDRLEGKIQN